MKANRREAAAALNKASPRSIRHESREIASRSNRLLDAGIAEFAERGFDGARVDVIARRAKVNKQLLYYYFKSKSGLYVASLERVYLRFRGDRMAIRQATTGVSATTALHNLVSHLFRRSAEFTQFQRLLQDANFHRKTHLRKLTGVREAYAVLLESIENILKRGVDEGSFRSGVNAKEFYISLVGVISARISNAATLSYVLDLDLVDKDYAARSHKYAIDLLMNGIMQEGVKAG